MSRIEWDGRNNDDIVRDTLVSYWMKHPKDTNFAFEHCWQYWGSFYIGRILELWNNSMRILKFLKGKLFANVLVAPSDSVCNGESSCGGIHLWCQWHSPTLYFCKPQEQGSSWNQASNEKFRKWQDTWARAQAQAQAQVSVEMARATHTKAQSLQDMMAQQLFGINIAKISDPAAHEYYA